MNLEPKPYNNIIITGNKNSNINFISPPHTGRLLKDEPMFQHNFQSKFHSILFNALFNVSIARFI